MALAPIGQVTQQYIAGSAANKAHRGEWIGKESSLLKDTSKLYFVVQPDWHKVQEWAEQGSKSGTPRTFEVAALNCIKEITSSVLDPASK